MTEFGMSTCSVKPAATGNGLRSICGTASGKLKTVQCLTLTLTMKDTPMVNINNVFDSDYLKATDLNDKPHLVTITNVEFETMRDNKQKLLVSFKEFDKGLLLNLTNANNIAAFAGPETDGWIGRQIVLFTAWVDFQGKSTEAIRVRAPKHKAATTQAAQAPVGPPPGHPAAMEDLAGDNVPF